MENLLQNELFRKGLHLGISLCQRIAIAAHERKEPIVIDGETYYIQSGGELLQQMMDEICR